jgi:hypothetical protein
VKGLLAVPLASLPDEHHCQLLFGAASKYYCGYSNLSKCEHCIYVQVVYHRLPNVFDEAMLGSLSVPAWSRHVFSM